MAPNDKKPEKPKLQLNRTTIRTLKKAELQQVAGGTITFTVCSVYCCPTSGQFTCGSQCSPSPA